MLFLLEEVELKPTEMAIYNYINANLDKVIYMRIRELADATYVSTTTITLDCRKQKTDTMRICLFLHILKCC